MPEQKKRERLWKSRPLRPGNEASLLELTEACTGKTITLDQWRWLFERNPGGKGVFRLGDHDGRLAGQYVILRQRMMIDGRETPGAQSLETMTHPDYRRQGMFVTLAKDVYRDAAEAGVEMVYGFPNTASHHGFVNRLDFADFPVPLHVRPLRAGSLLRKKAPLPGVGAFLGGAAQWTFDHVTAAIAPTPGAANRIAPEDGMDDSFDRLWARSRQSFPNMVVRDRAYLQWRYRDKVGIDYTILTARDPDDELLAFVVLRTFEKDGVRQGHIVDMLSDPDHPGTVGPLVVSALRTLREQGGEVAVCMLLAQSPYMGALRRAGFLVAPKKLPFIIRVNHPGIDLAALADPARWHVTIGDSDFV